MFGLEATIVLLIVVREEVSGVSRRRNFWRDELVSDFEEAMRVGPTFSPTVAQERLTLVAGNKAWSLSKISELVGDSATRDGN